MAKNPKSVGKVWLWFFFFTTCWLVSISPSGPKPGTQSVSLVQGTLTITHKSPETLHLLEDITRSSLVSVPSLKE